MGYTIENYRNILRHALDTGIGTRDEARMLGAMEAILVEHGRLTPGVPFKYRMIPYSYRKWWIIGPMIKAERKESYQNLMLREFDSFINQIDEIEGAAI